MSKRVLIATIGSLGDLHPCLALGLGLRERGHRVTIAATNYYRSKVESHGLGFEPIRPDWNPTDRELIRRCEDLKRGPEVLYRELLLPQLKGTYQDLAQVAADADLLIAGELVYAAPLVAEKLGLPWISAILSPFSFFSSCDPSVLVNVPGLIRLRPFGRQAYRAGLNLCRLATRHWSDPVRLLRRELGLRVQCDPVFRDKFSPHLVLALFSRFLAQPQTDWPAQTVQPGFVFFDGPSAESRSSPQLTDFLAAHDAPIVFTQGSTAVHNPGDFYEVSAQVAKRLGRRALLVGAPAALAESHADLLALPYAPYSQIFPHAAVNVHQGGSGTTGQALKAGRPMLIVPYGWDQPDNAARAARLGVALHIPRNIYSMQTALPALERLLADLRFAARATEIGTQLEVDAVSSACNAIESVLTAR